MLLYFGLTVSSSATHSITLPQSQENNCFTNEFVWCSVLLRIGRSSAHLFYTVHRCSVQSAVTVIQKCKKIDTVCSNLAVASFAAVLVNTLNIVLSLRFLPLDTRTAGILFGLTGIMLAIGAFALSWRYRSVVIGLGITKGVMTGREISHIRASR